MKAEHKLWVTNRGGYLTIDSLTISKAISYLEELACKTSFDARIDCEYTDSIYFAVDWLTEESDEAYALRTKMDAQKAIERAEAQLVKDKAEYERLQGIFGEKVK